MENVKKLKGTNGSRVLITPEITKKILDDCQSMKQSEVARKYRVSRVAICRIVKEHPHEPTITERKNLDPLKRIEILAGDSTSVLELTIYSMKTLLEADIKAKKDNPEAKSIVTIRELKEFFETVAPYVLQKVESSPRAKGEKTPLAKVHNMFAKKTAT